ncbi:MAG: hypothetical protein WBP41_10720 [Saprospiraceae bacterium]
MNNQKLLETVSDISYIAGENKYFSGNSRADVSTFIFWAKEFQKENLKTNWHEVDYISSIEAFTENKLIEFLY